MKVQSHERMFTHDTKTNHLCTEASDLQKNGEDLFHRIPNTNQIGLTVVSHRTGREATWCVIEEIRSNDEDWELQGWKLVPIRETIQRIPILASTTMTIYND